MPLTFWILYWTFTAALFGSVVYYTFLRNWLLKRKRYKAKDYRFNTLMRESNSIRCERRNEMKNTDVKSLLDKLEGMSKNEWELLKFEIDRKFNEMSSQNRLEGRHVDNLKNNFEQWL